MATPLARPLPVLPRVALAVLLASAACSRPEEPPGELTADHVAEALGGVPHGGTQRGPSLIVPDEFADVWETWTGPLLRGPGPTGGDPL
jgi:hypothetical protein